MVTRRWRVLGQSAVGVALAVFTMIAAWQAAYQLFGQKRIPSPRVGVTLFLSTLMDGGELLPQNLVPGAFLDHVWATCWTTVVAVIIGGSLGFYAGAVAGSLDRIRVGEKVVEVVRGVPPLVAVPIILVVGQPASTSGMLIVGAYSALFVFLYAVQASRILPAELDRLGVVYGAGKWRRLHSLQMPAIVPHLAGGVRYTASVGLGIMVVAEYLQGAAGLGRVVKVALGRADLPLIVVTCLWAAAIGVVIDAGVRLTFSRIAPWRQS